MNVALMRDADARKSAIAALAPLLCIAIGALAIRILWMAWSGPDELPMDGAEYARTAGNIFSGAGYVGIRGATQFVFPPFYPLLIAALMPLAGSAARAGLDVSLISGAAFVFPVFGITSLCYGRKAAYAAAIVAAILPFTVQLSTVVLADMLFLTLATTGLYFLLACLARQRLADGVACGVAFGCAYLTRPEGILLAVLAAVAAIVYFVAARRPPAAIVRLVAAIVLPFALLALPYVVFLSTHAGHLRIEGKSILNLDIGMRMQRGMSYGVAADAIDDQLNEVGPELRADYYFEPAGRSAPSLQSVIVFGAQNTVRHVREIGHVLVSRLGGSLPLLILALVGFVAGPWRGRSLWNQLVLLAYGAVITLSLASVFHFWDRYFVGYVPLLVVWAGNGIDVVARALTRRALPHWLTFAPVVLTGVFLAVLAFSTKMNFTADSVTTAESDAGAWLAAHGGAGARMLSISDQAVYYAGGVWSMLPYAPDDRAALGYVRKMRPDYVILDSEYASERPYVVRWLAGGIPDPSAHVVYRTGQGTASSIAVVKWSK